MTSSPKATKILTIAYDQGAEGPDSMCDGWKVISFCRRHSNFEHPDKYRTCKPASLGFYRKLETGLAFWLSYYEHGLCRWSMRGEGPQCRWDSVDVAGVLLWTSDPAGLGAKTYEDRAADARRFLEEYTEWCNGHCYWFSLETPEQQLESCGGFIGADQLAEAVNEALEDGDQVIVRGEAADLARTLPLKATMVEEAA
jgi:hypothetical protein